MSMPTWVRHKLLLLARFTIISLLMVLEKSHQNVRQIYRRENSSFGLVKADSKTVARVKNFQKGRGWMGLPFVVHSRLVTVLNRLRLNPAVFPSQLNLTGPGPRQVEQNVDAVRISNDSHLNTALRLGDLSRCKVAVGNQGLADQELQRKIFEANSGVILVCTEVTWNLLSPGTNLVLATSPRYVMDSGHPNTLVTFMFFCIAVQNISLKVDGVSLWIRCESTGVYQDLSHHSSLSKDLRHHHPASNFLVVKGLRGRMLLESPCLQQVLDLEVNEYLEKLEKELGL